MSKSNGYMCIKPAVIRMSVADCIEGLNLTFALDNNIIACCLAVRSCLSITCV